jgi:hypothetical protein
VSTACRVLSVTAKESRILETNGCCAGGLPGRMRARSEGVGWQEGQRTRLEGKAEERKENEVTESN